MKTLKRAGPTTEPWGIPLVTRHQPDVTPLTVTLRGWPTSQLLAHHIMGLSSCTVLFDTVINSIEKIPMWPLSQHHTGWEKHQQAQQTDKLPHTSQLSQEAHCSVHKTFLCQAQHCKHLPQKLLQFWCSWVANILLISKLHLPLCKTKLGINFL